MSRGAGETGVPDEAPTAERDVDDGDADDGGSPDLWEAVRADLTEVFGEDVAFTVAEYGDHLDVRVMPDGAIQDVEAAHDVRIVPYDALRMTIRKDE